MLYSYSERPDEVASFTPLSSVRRELKSLYNEKQELRKEIDQSYRIFDAFPCGYLHIDRDNQLLWCNQTARELLHLNRWQPGEVRLLLELVRSYELDRLIEQTRKHQASQTRAWEFHPSHDAQTRADSQGQSVHLRGSTLLMRSGDIAVFLENEESLHVVKQAQEKLLSDLTHELRTPLTAMRLITETLSPRLQGQENKWSRQLLGEINRLYYLVQDWLELSRLAAHPHQVLSHQTFDLVQLIDEVWEKLDLVAAQKQVNLNYTGEESLKIEGDRDRLTQVLLNLFDNAIKYNPANCPIHVKVQHQNVADIATIDVIDQGVGFGVEDLPYVFERLYRGDQARVRQPKSPNLSKGNGLGLAIVQQIISAHYGEITARNHPELGGAWLHVKLPTTMPRDDLDT